MINALSPMSQDLAGFVYSHPHYFQIQRQGAKTLKELLRCCKDWGIKALTAYAFSTENGRRPLEEVDFLMLLFEKLLRQELAQMHREGVRISFIGDLSILPTSLQTEIERSMAETLHNQALHFTVAVNYGSRSEIARACRQIAQLVQQGELSPEDVQENLIEQTLYTTGTPEPNTARLRKLSRETSTFVQGLQGVQGRKKRLNRQVLLPNQIY